MQIARQTNARPLLILVMGFLFTCTTVLAQPADYIRIVVFGDSLSDTGNFAHLTEAKYGFRVPGPVANYANGRFTDGYETIPAARKYFGVWIEQYAASLPSHPSVKDSLDGGTNYAYGDATIGGGTTVSTFGPSNSYSVNVKNIDQQISDYLATHPKINNRTLFVIWGGANDLLAATSATQIIDAATRQTLNVQRLIEAGATQFIVPNLPPLGLIPRLNGSPKTSVPATEASALFDVWLATGLGVLRDIYKGKGVHISELDTFSLFEKVVASPSKYGLVNVTKSSQGDYAVDPDNFLFWDDLHPTTHGHDILAHAAADLLRECEASGSACAAAQQ